MRSEWIAATITVVRERGGNLALDIPGRDEDEQLRVAGTVGEDEAGELFVILDEKTASALATRAEVERAEQALAERYEDSASACRQCGGGGPNNSVCGWCADQEREVV